MSHKEFGPNDIFINRVKMHPEWDFFIYNSQVFINNSQNISGSHSGNYKGVPPGYLSLYEYNLDRSGSFISPFVLPNTNYKTRFRNDLKNLTGKRKTGLPFSQLVNSGTASANYQMSASITRQYLAGTFLKVEGPQGHIYPIAYHNNTSSAIKNMCMQYARINPSFSNTLVSTLTGSDVSPLDSIFNGDINMINIPSIFYGSEMKKGTIELNYYITGTLIATAKDTKQNGQLVCTLGPAGVSGSVVGHTLYREGILFFPKTSTATTTSLDSGNGIEYNGSISDAQWLHFGHGANEKDDTGASVEPADTHSSASYSIKFEGTTYKNTMTLFCHADKGELNYSNNPTFLNTLHSSSIVGYSTSSYTYSDNEVEIKNIASSSFHKGEDEFRKVTYISKVGIYDEHDNLLMTVDLARPYKKEEKDNFTFKIKYDLL